MAAMLLLSWSLEEEKQINNDIGFSGRLSA
jgi:hypothetical protein